MELWILDAKGKLKLSGVGMQLSPEPKFSFVEENLRR